MKEPVWIDEQDALTIHDRLLALHGGPSGVRDQTLLSSALARPRQHLAYSTQADIIRMAAAYTAGIVGNHPHFPPSLSKGKFRVFSKTCFKAAGAI